MDIPEKDQKSGFVECWLLVCELQLLRGWSCGVTGARSDTFHAADRLERTRGIYWLCYTGSGGGVKDSIHFFFPLSLSFNSTNISESQPFSILSPVLPKKKGYCKQPVMKSFLACRSRSSASPTRLAQSGMSLCVVFLPSALLHGCMTHEMIRAARPRPHARPHASALAFFRYGRQLCLRPVKGAPINQCVFFYATQIAV